jgi:hypothetical protein
MKTKLCFGKNNEIPSYISIGGIFLYKIICQLIMGFICGLLVIRWIPLSFPVDITNLFVQFILNPLEFFAASLVFIIGIVMNGNVIHSIITMTFVLKNKNSFSLAQWFVSFGVIFNFILLMNEGLWQAVMLLIFSIVYGMISIDFQKVKVF